MSVIVIGNQKTRPTGQKIAMGLQADYCENYMPKNKPYSLIFRYGNSYLNLPNRTEKNVVINPSHAIEKVVNKPLARNILVNNGISAPKIYLSGDLDNAYFPLLARPIYHYKGRNFYLIYTIQKAKEFLDRGFYIQEFINKKDEYRVFLLNGKFFEVCKKINKGNVINTNIRNHGMGWYFQWIPYITLDERLLNFCRAIYSLFSINFCAIDCCIDVNNKPFIFEINSAPALIDRKITKLCQKIKEIYTEYL
jgi:glutathione synthase/RimK-type ligase-like ATP-grasp enzyme